MVFCLAGCTSGTSVLAGKWVPEKGRRVPGDFMEKRLEISKNGTGIGMATTLNGR